MTVQELIDALNKVEDKSPPVYYYDGFGDYGDIDEIETHEGEDGDVEQNQDEPNDALSGDFGGQGFPGEALLVAGRSVHEGRILHHSWPPLGLAFSFPNLRLSSMERKTRISMTRAMKDPSFHCDWEKWR